MKIIKNIANFFLWPGHSAIALHRASHFCQRGGKIGRGVGHILWRINGIINNIDISPEAKIGRNLYIPHCVGIVIGACTIGDNVVILQNVTIGKNLANDYGDKNTPDGYPAIGNNVTIYAGATVVGPIGIGNYARIGAHAVVMSDVPDNCTAIGIPARIIPKKSSF